MGNYYFTGRTQLPGGALNAENGIRHYHIREHVFSRQELSADLAAAGFSAIHFHGDIAGAPYRPAGRTIGVIAYK